MSQRFKDFSEDKLDRIVRGPESEREKYAQEALDELHEDGLTRKFWTELEDEFDEFSPQNRERQRRRMKKIRKRRNEKKARRDKER